MDTICACATARGGHLAVLRLSGPAAAAVAAASGLDPGAPWTVREQTWALAGGRCPCRVLFCAAPRSFTGCDLVEITLPGAADLIDLGLEALLRAGAVAATPGAFTRQAVANGRLRLDQAEALLALAQAATASAAAQALGRLRGALSERLGPVRTRLIALRALVEAGLDAAEEDEVPSCDPEAVRRELASVRDAIAAFRVTADQLEPEPRVCLVGAANAGKSALFNRLTGSAALVDAVPGTTRDWLDAPWLVGGRAVRLVDTAGWRDASPHPAGGTDALALAAGRRTWEGAALLLACSAPDAALPPDHGLPAERTLVIATKADLGSGDARAVLGVSARTGAGLGPLAELVAGRLAGVAGGEPRQQRLLGQCLDLLSGLLHRLPADELLADDLALLADLLGELIGATTPEEVLDAIFSRFCIGK